MKNLTTRYGGVIAAARRANKMAEGYNLSDYKMKLLSLTSNLMVIQHNLMYQMGLEPMASENGEPNPSIAAIVKLTREIHDHLAFIFEGTVAPDSLMAKLRGEETG